MGWRIYAASATGTSHLDKGIPCQDACAFHAHGDALVAVVCDGAGSAARSDVGSRVVADTVARELGERFQREPDWLGEDRDGFFAIAAAAVQSARAALIEIAAADEASLSSYAATLVGYAGDAHGGWFFHIGDGIGVAEAAGADGEAAAEPVVSLPANGEYANETYFVTGEAWREQLRVLRAPAPAARLALMSDGAMPFAMQKNNAGLFQPFFEPVTRYLASVDEAQGSRALLGTLEDPRTHGITSDDKTLLIALRG
ncbi:PP2C family serine/threonine-protein phosphatase [Pseudomonas sp. CGJS7]|uniref:PP2C family serine/threonine-protein phosphatase n=1 Tax=Pseudomonas sp. CGJS7 TaxID=3109348 RepID=UPI003009A535